MKITASDRSAMIRLAASLPKGSEERRSVLAALNGMGKEHVMPMEHGIPIDKVRENFSNALEVTQKNLASLKDKIDAQFKKSPPLGAAKGVTPTLDESGNMTYETFSGKKERYTPQGGTARQILNLSQKVRGTKKIIQQYTQKIEKLRGAASLPKGSEERRSVLAALNGMLMPQKKGDIIVIMKPTVATTESGREVRLSSGDEGTFIETVYGYQETPSAALLDQMGAGAYSGDDEPTRLLATFPGVGKVFLLHSDGFLNEQYKRILQGKAKEYYMLGQLREMLQKATGSRRWIPDEELKAMVMKHPMLAKAILT